MKLTQVTGAILAGGRATRMNGQDKGLLLLGGRPLWQHIYQRLTPQTASIVISANRNIAEYQKSGLPIIEDTLAGFPGPLAGILAVLESPLLSPDRQWFLFCPCDVPHIPDNLAQRLWDHKRDALAAWVHDGERDHPTVALIHRSLAPAIRAYLLAGERRVMVFMAQAGGISVPFPGHNGAFANMNTPDDLNQWQETM